jgi:ABC-2 type transport system permease protein
MKAFLSTFQIGFKYLWRNPVSVAILIIFPIAIILILGNALSSYITVDTKLDPAPIAVAADPNGQFGSFMQMKEIIRFFDLNFTDRAHAEELVTNGDVIAAIIEAPDGSLSVLSGPENNIYSGLTLSMVDSYAQIGAASAIAAMSGRNIYEIIGADVSIADKPLGKRIPSAIDYYAVTMLVMILMYTGMNGLELFNKGLLSDTGRRMRTSPVPKSALIGGLLAASTVTSFLQGMVTFVFTAAVYGVYWGDRIAIVLLALFAVVLFSQSLCIMLMMLIQNNGAVTGITQALFWTMTFVSKGYARISFGDADKIFQYAPNALAHTVIFGAAYGGNETKMALSLAALFAISAILFIFAFFLGRRRIV